MIFLLLSVSFQASSMKMDRKLFLSSPKYETVFGISDGKFTCRKLGIVYSLKLADDNFKVEKYRFSCIECHDDKDEPINKEIFIGDLDNDEKVDFFEALKILPPDKLERLADKDEQQRVRNFQEISTTSQFLEFLEKLPVKHSIFFKYRKAETGFCIRDGRFTYWEPGGFYFLKLAEDEFNVEKNKLSYIGYNDSKNEQIYEEITFGDLDNDAKETFFDLLKILPQDEIDQLADKDEQQRVRNIQKSSTPCASLGVTESLSSVVPIIPSDKGTKVFFTHSNDNIEQELINKIKKAKKRIYVAVYLFTSQDILGELVNAKGNGIDVRIIVDVYSYVCNNPMLLYNKKRLKECEIEVRVVNKNNISQNSDVPLMHHKFAIIDDFVWTGSYNWTWKANNTNFENVVIFYDEKICKEYEKVFNDLWKELSGSYWF